MARPGGAGVEVVLPAGIDDPAQPSGGNVYDRRLCRGLESAGWLVREHAVAGPWPDSDAAALNALRDVLSELPDGATVLIDGLVASASAPVLVPAASRLRLAVLVHMPFGLGGTPTPAHDESGERAVLRAAATVITTSEWTRRRVLAGYGLPADRIHVATPGADPAPPAGRTRAGTELLCVAAVIPAKGHDVLLGALTELTDRRWRCRCVGSLTRDPGFAGSITGRSAAGGIADRVRLTGPLTGPALSAAYAGADLLVSPSRFETYGMVVTEALAHGIPVLATDVGGVSEALGTTPAGFRPGILVPADDPTTLAGALRAWLDSEELRGRLRAAALDRRASLPSWESTTSRVAEVLAGVAA